MRSEAGWLIEKAWDGPCEWLYIDMDAPIMPAWTRDSVIALRFARECDAVAVKKVLRIHTKVVFTEHIWAGPIPLPPQ